MDVLEMSWIEYPAQNLEVDRQNYVLLVKVSRSLSHVFEVKSSLVSKITFFLF